VDIHGLAVGAKVAVNTLAARQSHILTPRPFLFFFVQNGLQAKSGFEMCFDIGSQHPWVLGPTHVSNPE
jgi:hypothetical protein